MRCARTPCSEPASAAVEEDNVVEAVCARHGFEELLGARPGVRVALLRAGAARTTSTPRGA